MLQFDGIEPAFRSRRPAQPVGRFPGHRRRVGVAGVNAEVAVLLGLQRSQRRNRLGAPHAQQVIAPGRDGDGGQHRDHDQRREHFGERESAAAHGVASGRHSMGTRCQESRSSSPRW